MKRLMSVAMFLRDMLYVSYIVPIDNIKPHIPGELKPAAVADGHVFVTLVIFRGKTSGAFRIPSPPIPFDQVNIRTYVTDPITGKPAVYFVHCGISGALITSLYRILSGMPVEHTPFRIHPGRGTQGNYEQYTAKGQWRGDFTIAAREISPAVESLHPFSNAQEAMDYLIDPLVGFYLDRGTLKRLEVYHEPLKPCVCEPTGIRFPYLTQLGIVPEDMIAFPHNVLIVESTPFLIYLPAKRFPING